MQWSDNSNKAILSTRSFHLHIRCWAVVTCSLLLHLFRSAIRFFFTNWTLQLVVVWKKHRALVGIIQVFFKMIPPSFIMLVLFIHMVHKTSLSTVASAESKAKMRWKMTRMVGIASLLLIICFAPSQTFYALACAMAGITQLDSKIHPVLFWLLSTAPWIHSYTEWATGIIAVVTES